MRDAQATLEACLRSLRRQTLRDHEVVAVDDGSSDGTAALLERAAARDPRVRVARTPARGVVAALNTALELARAPLLARMDADDRAHRRRLELQARHLGRHPEVGVLGSRVAYRRTGVGLSGRLGPGMEAYVRWSNGLLLHRQILRDLLVESPLVHPSVTMRATLLRRLGGYRSFDGPEDYDLWLRAAEAGARFAKRPEVLLEWHDRPDRLTRADPRYRSESFFALKLEALARAWPDAARPVVVWGAGPIGKAWARALLARGRRVAAFVDVDPRRIGQRIHGAPVLACTRAVLLPRALHLAAVGQPGARERIRREARRLGVRARDLVAVA